MKLDPQHDRQLRINTALISVGVIGAIYGLYCCVWAAVGILGHHLPHADKTLADCVMYFGLLAAGAGLTFWKITERVVMLQTLKEQAILSYVSRSPGTAFTLLEISTNSGLLLDDANKLLNKMATMSVCELKISDSGKVRYLFHEMPDAALLGDLNHDYSGNHEGAPLSSASELKQTVKTSEAPVVPSESQPQSDAENAPPKE